MEIAVLGTGMVGKTLTAGFQRVGHTVTVGTRDPEVTAAREEWTDSRLATYADAARGADLVVLAVGGNVAEEVLAQADLEDGAIVLDLTNPLDFSNGFPPTLTVKDTDSLAEVLQRAHPTAQVVKALNTVNCALMVTPQQLADGDHTIFIAGDDAAARAHVHSLLQDLGWVDIVEFPSLEAARGLEMYLPLWLRLMQQLGTPQFNLKLVR
ncbi:NADPH-dependent F420 reductase [Nocardioides jiangxiensis]|uniref:NAD(P)-binding domain-containing protein n=1 Tax=Nocardioides jiangxiensis TaxID=3064524 RepID=A0ABT9B0G8_9ACTN|nr:NAD(P)-binding domain-containing protein [Nocardioides sp. WY-20]MDO7868347.1 NAD(P)-binding domain-containing protein [Nocardioides sp. WY-20]